MCVTLQRNLRRKSGSPNHHGICFNHPHLLSLHLIKTTLFRVIPLISKEVTLRDPLPSPLSISPGIWRGRGKKSVSEVSWSACCFHQPVSPAKCPDASILIYPGQAGDVAVPFCFPSGLLKAASSCPPPPGRALSPADKHVCLTHRFKTAFSLPRSFLFCCCF